MKNFYTLLIALFMFSANIFAQEPIDTDGNGYRNISTLEQLRWISENDSSWSWKFELDNDIDASDTKNWNVGDHDENPATPDSAMGWKPLGNWETAFTGTILGKGHDIENLFINRPEETTIAFIGTANGMELQFLHLTNCYISGSSVVSSLVAYNSQESKIQYCSASGNIFGSEGIGGLVSQNLGNINDCFSVVNVTGEKYVSGFVNFNDNEILRCYSAGKVKASQNVDGGFSVQNSGKINNCFWDIESSGLINSKGGEGKTSVEMKLKSTYTEAGWNFTALWQINVSFNDGYPILNQRTIEVPVGIEPIDTDGNGYKNVSLFEHLIWISNNDSSWDLNFELDNDINTSQVLAWNTLSGFSPIGNKLKPFSGKFDGKGHTIDSLFINRISQDYIGFFGKVRNAELTNIKITNCYVSGNDNVGGLVGDLDKTIVSNCYTTGKVFGVYIVGGLIGNADDSVIENSFSTSNLNSDYTVGGLVGRVYSSSINNCNNSGEVNGIGVSGGLVGRVYSSSINNCNNSGEVNGNDNTGGLVGSIEYAKVTNCYNSGEVNGNDNTGGLVGSIEYAKVTKCYNSSEVNGNDNTGGLVGKVSSSIVGDCNNSGEVAGANHSGGLIGYNYNNSIINNSYNSGIVNGSYIVGGLIGLNEEYSIVMNSYNSESINGTSGIGGIAGDNDDNSVIINCYNKGSVTGTDYLGGLVGDNNSNSFVINCYNKGSVTGTNHSCGLIGACNDLSTVINSFWDIETSGTSYSKGGIGKTTVEMKDISTYTDVGWNFDFIWEIESDYPFIAIDTSYRPIDIDGNGFLNISTLAHLQWLSESGYDKDKYFELDNNINAENTSKWKNNFGFFPIQYFTGKFEGNGYFIDNLYINMPNLNNIGLFANPEGVKISNLGVTNCNIYGNDNVGGLAGQAVASLMIDNYSSGNVNGKFNVGGLIGNYSYSDTISECFSTCKVNGKDGVGGLLGYVNGSLGEVGGITLFKCYSSGTVTGNDNTGGLIGDNSGSHVIMCYSTSSVAGDNNTGGLIGNSHSGISLCYSTGSVKGYDNVGGLVGLNEYVSISNSFSRSSVEGYSNFGGFVGNLNESYVKHCYSTGTVNVNLSAGGFLGHEESTIIESCFWDKETSQISSSYGGIPKTTAEMKTKSTFTDVGWDFDEIWYISPEVNDGYPFFIGMDSIPSAVSERVISDSDIFIYPNPAEDYIEITLDGAHLVGGHHMEIEIFDVLGEKIMFVETRHALSLQRIDVSQLPRGVYFVKIGDRVEKFVKM